MEYGYVIFPNLINTFSCGMLRLKKAHMTAYDTCTTRKQFFRRVYQILMRILMNPLFIFGHEINKEELSY
jgi:hypothetical protein